MSCLRAAQTSTRFGENIRYEIHVKNDAGNCTRTDDITYRFTFTRVERRPDHVLSGHAWVRKTSKPPIRWSSSLVGGTTFSPLIADGVVPPAPNIGPRSIEGLLAWVSRLPYVC
ncbi:MAG: DUF4331 family protein [Hymenobacter sp.]